MFKFRVAHHLACLSLGAAALGFSVSASGEPGGTYVIDSGGYSIEVKMDGENLVVVEPNKTSVYEKQGDGSYQFTNPNNGITYGIRVVDDRTIEAFKPGSDSPATRLSLLGSTEGSSPAVVADSDKYEAIAGHYSELAGSGSADAQAYSACAAVAMKRSVATQADADVYANQMAGMIRQIMVDPSVNPCPDVFTAW
jgi:hypothetical protein